MQYRSLVMMCGLVVVAGALWLSGSGSHVAEAGVDALDDARRPPLSLVGRAEVVDGDSLRVNGVSIRLEGIDAAEIDQTCHGAGARSWAAGRAAANYLRRQVRGRDVVCDLVGDGGYGRQLGRCRVGSHDLNAAMIEQGLAWAFRKYSASYVAREKAARLAGVGIWGLGATCQPAWDFRRNRWTEEVATAPNGCAIKGNITRRGRIYHMPWSPWYGRTRVEAARGERWFCDEAQAMAAGWRPAVVY